MIDPLLTLKHSCGYFIYQLPIGGNACLLQSHSHNTAAVQRRLEIAAKAGVGKCHIAVVVVFLAMPLPFDSFATF